MTTRQARRTEFGLGAITIGLQATCRDLILGLSRVPLAGKLTLQVREITTALRVATEKRRCDVRPRHALLGWIWHWRPMRVARGLFTILAGVAVSLSCDSEAPRLAPPTAIATVASQVPTSLLVQLQPAGAISGSNLATQPVVSVRDAIGSIVIGSTDQVTAAIASGTGTLSGTSTVPAVNGVAKFSNLTVTGSGAHTVEFTSGVLAPDTSSGFTVVLPPTKLFLATQPSSAISGQALPPVTVQVHDASSSVVLGATASITAAISSGATLAGTTTVSAVNGAATFSNLIVTGTGPHTLTFTSGILTPAISNSFTVVVLPTQLFVAQQPAGAVSGQVFTTPPTVQVRDASNNLVLGSTVSFAAILKLSREAAYADENQRPLRADPGGRGRP